MQHTLTQGTRQRCMGNDENTVVHKVKEAPDGAEMSVGCPANNSIWRDYDVDLRLAKFVPNSVSKSFVPRR